MHLYDAALVKSRCQASHLELLIVFFGGSGIKWLLINMGTDFCYLRSFFTFPRSELATQLIGPG
jgi:hypothetical protein